MSVKSAVETLNPTRVKLSVEVPFEELQPSLNEAYKRIGAQVTVPGFRKGKVPSRIIDQRFGRGVVLEEALNAALPGFYNQAVDDLDINPLGQPEVEVVEFADGAELKFTAEVDVRPEITVPELGSVKAVVPDLSVDDEAVEKQLTALRERFATTNLVERAAVDGDFLTIDLSASKDDEPIEDAQATNLSYKIGSDTMVPGLDEAVTGLSAGESAKFQSQLMGTHEGEDVDIEVTVTAVKEQILADLDDEFAQLASEFDTVEELRADVRERLTRMARLEQALAARDKVLDALLDSVDVPLPEGVVSKQIDQHFEDGHGDDEHREEFATDARRNLKAQLILDEVVKAEEIQVSQDELTQYLIQRAAQQKMDPNEFADLIVRSNGVASLVSDVARGKALALVVEKASVTDESGNEIDLARLQEDGTYADPDDDEDDAVAEAAAESEQA